MTLGNRRFLRAYTPIANELQPAMTSPPPCSTLGPGISRAAPAPYEDGKRNISSPPPPTTVELPPGQIPMLDPPLDRTDSGATMPEPQPPPLSPPHGRPHRERRPPKLYESETGQWIERGVQQPPTGS